MHCILNLAACRCSEQLGAHEPLVRFLLRDALAATQLESEPEPEPKPEPEPEPEPEPKPELERSQTHSSGHCASRPTDAVLAADARQVAYQAGVTEVVARDALVRNGYEMVAAVLDLATGNCSDKEKVP